MLDEKADIFKVQHVYGKYSRRCGGHKRAGGCALPGAVQLDRCSRVDFGCKHILFLAQVSVEINRLALLCSKIRCYSGYSDMSLQKVKSHVEIPAL